MEEIEGNILTFLLFSMVLIVLIATFGRYTKLFVILWSDEYARYAMVYLAFLGIAIGTREKRHYNTTVLVNALPQKVGYVVYILRSLLTLFFYGFITYWAYKLCAKNIQMHQISPTLKIPMWIPYFAVILGMGGSVIWSIYNIIKDPLGKNKNAEEEDLL